MIYVLLISDYNMDTFLGGKEHELRILLTSAVTQEVCAERKIHLVETEVEQLQGQVSLLANIKEAKTKYRDALLEHLECLEGKREAVEKLRAVAVEKVELAEVQRREVMRDCALALGQRVQPAVCRQLPATVEEIRTEVKRLQQLLATYSEVQLSRQCHLYSSK